MQNIAEIIEKKVPVEMRNIKIKAKQQENDVIDNKASNNQKQQKEATGIGQRKGKVEEKKYSDSEKQNEGSKTYTF